MQILTISMNNKYYTLAGSCVNRKVEKSSLLIFVPNL